MKFTFGNETPHEESPLKIIHNDPSSSTLIANRLAAILKTVPAYRPIVFVCIGTDRSTGDSLGPLVGTYLKRQNYWDVHLYDTLDEPVHAMNLSDTLRVINKMYDNPYVVGIDACLGQSTSVGCIQVGLGPVKPGAGVNKELPSVGDMHITGIVNVGGFMEFFALQNTRLSLVMNMAEVIAKSISVALISVKTQVS